MKTVLNSSLTPIEFKSSPNADFLRSFEDHKEVGHWQTGTREQHKLVVRDDLPVDGILHKNSLEYLSFCWKNHYGVVLKPDIIWFDLLCEVASLIRKNPEQYRKLFTISEEKVKIEIYTTDPEVMPMDSLLGMLKLLVPTDTDKFLPEFSTSTPKSVFAHSVAFADCVSPYYDYMMYMCGIPSVTLAGTPEDWNLLYERWIDVTELMGIPLPDDGWANKVSGHLYSLALIADSHCTNDFKKTTLSNIFKLERCGSGSQVEIFGWYAELFKDVPKVRYIQNFSSHVAQIGYKNLTNGKSYQMSAGVFSSTVVDGDLVPDYNMVVAEELQAPINISDENDSVETAFKIYHDLQPRKLKAAWTVEKDEFASLNLQVKTLWTSDQE